MVEQKKRYVTHPKQGIVQVALDDGRIAYVTPDGVELEKHFWAQAARQGLFPVGVDLEDDHEDLVITDRLEGLKSVILDMIENPQEGYFTASGVPDRRALNKKAGYTVPRDDAAAAWYQIQADLDANDSSDESDLENQ